MKEMLKDAAEMAMWTIIGLIIVGIDLVVMYELFVFLTENFIPITTNMRFMAVMFLVTILVVGIDFLVYVLTVCGWSVFRKATRKRMA